MTKVILYLENCNPDAGFHYGRKEGGDLTFIYNRARSRHEAIFTIEEWRADNFRIAKSLLDQNLVFPVFFDIEEESAASCVAAATDADANSVSDADRERQQSVEPEAAPSGSDAPPAARRQRKPRLTEQQKLDAQKEFEAQSKAEADEVPAFIPK